MLRTLYASAVFPLTALATILFTACSTGREHPLAPVSEGGGGSGEDAIVATNPISGDVGGGDIGEGGGATTGAGLDPDAGCAGTSIKAKMAKLDIYIMLDQSKSMSQPVAVGGTKWQAVSGALTSFVRRTDLADVSVGIQYFGLPASVGTGKTDSCTASDYAFPDVEIASLPGVAPAIVSSMSAHYPMTQTPTSAALQGAISHAEAWAGKHPDHTTIVILATDGNPTECDTSIQHIKAIAAAGANGTPRILTFVIGVGDSLDALDQIAIGGGTGSAFLVDTAHDTSQQFMQALEAIRGSAIGCSFAIPDPTMDQADFGAVNVKYTPSGGSPKLFPQVSDEAHCPTKGDAWHYDNPANPAKIVLCGGACKDVRADALSQLDVVLGCKTILK